MTEESFEIFSGGSVTSDGTSYVLVAGSRNENTVELDAVPGSSAEEISVSGHFFDEDGDYSVVDLEEGEYDGRANSTAQTKRRPENMGGGGKRVGWSGARKEDYEETVKPISTLSEKHLPFRSRGDGRFQVVVQTDGEKPKVTTTPFVGYEEDPSTDFGDIVSRIHTDGYVCFKDISQGNTGGNTAGRYFREPRGTEIIVDGREGLLGHSNMEPCEQYPVCASAESGVSQRQLDNNQIPSYYIHDRDCLGEHRPRCACTDPYIGKHDLDFFSMREAQGYDSEATSTHLWLKVDGLRSQSSGTGAIAEFIRPSDGFTIVDGRNTDVNDPKQGTFVRLKYDRGFDRWIEGL